MCVYRPMARHTGKTAQWRVTYLPIFHADTRWFFDNHNIGVSTKHLKDTKGVGCRPCEQKHEAPEQARDFRPYNDKRTIAPGRVINVSVIEDRYKNVRVAVYSDEGMAFGITQVLEAGRKIEDFRESVLQSAESPADCCSSGSSAVALATVLYGRLGRLSFPRQ